MLRRNCGVVLNTERISAQIFVILKKRAALLKMIWIQLFLYTVKDTTMPHMQRTIGKKQRSILQRTDTVHKLS